MADINFTIESRADGKNFVRANFAGGRWVYSIGREGKRSSKFIQAAEKANASLERDGIPATLGRMGTLTQRMKLILNRIAWNDKQTEVSIWANDKAATITIPDGIDKEALDKALKSELLNSKPDFKKVITGFLTEGKDELFGFWQAVIDGKIKPRNGKTLRPSTLTNKNQTLAIVKEYNPKLTFADMDMKFYNKFTEWLGDKTITSPSGKPGKDFDPNNIGKHVKELKSILHLARKNEQEVSDKFIYWSVTKEPNEIVTLSKEEVIKIMDLNLKGIRKDVRDIFVMACFLGLRIGDLSKLSVKDNYFKENGVEYFGDVTGKTGARVKIPLFPQVKKLLLERDGLPVMISEQNFRENLKEICKAAKLNDRVVIKIRDGVPVYKVKHEAITPHSARRTFATALFYGWWSKPLPASLCMRYTGHKSEKSFMKYIGANEAALDAKALEILEFTPSMKIA
jgi:integrase